MKYLTILFLFIIIIFGLINNRVSYKYEVDLYETGVNITNKALSNEEKLKFEVIKNSIDKNYNIMQLILLILVGVLVFFLYQDAKNQKIKL
jgi:NADH:ubiquinone oxidoreductase subunit 3 (subunit A)